MLHYFWDTRCITLMNFYMLTFFCLFFFFFLPRSNWPQAEAFMIRIAFLKIIFLFCDLTEGWRTNDICVLHYDYARGTYMYHWGITSHLQFEIYIYIWKIHHFTIHQKVIFTQPKLIHEVCRIFKLTMVHCDYYHANKNKCFLNQINNAHYISVQKAISQRKKQTDGIQFHFLPLDFHWAET